MNPAFIGIKIRIVVLALSGQNLKFINPFGIISKMQFAKHGCLVTGLLKKLREGNLCGIKRKTIVNLSMNVTMLTRKNSGSGWSTNRIGYTGIGK